MIPARRSTGAHRRPPGPTRWLLASLAVSLLSCGAQAQFVLDQREELAFDRPEAWALQYFTSTLMMSGFGVPSSVSAGDIGLGFDGAHVPSLDEDQRRVGFEGNKVEDLNRTDAVGRLRVDFGLPRRIRLVVGYTPPVELDGAEPEVLAFSVERPMLERSAFRLGLRLHGHIGEIDGDFTCTADEAAAGADPEANPFSCESPSRDTMRTRYAGLELASSFRPNRRIRPYVAASLNYLDLSFQVRAEYAGVIDRTREDTEGSTITLAGGAQIRLARRIQLGVEIFYAPLEVVRPPGSAAESDDLVQGRLALRFAVR